MAAATPLAAMAAAIEGRPRRHGGGIVLRLPPSEIQTEAPVAPGGPMAALSPKEMASVAASRIAAVAMEHATSASGAGLRQSHAGSSSSGWGGGRQPQSVATLVESARGSVAGVLSALADGAASGAGVAHSMADGAIPEAALRGRTDDEAELAAEGLTAL